MIQLNTQQVYIPQQPPPVAPPVQSFTFVKPVSYEFRVAEHLDQTDKVIKVALQVQVWEHNDHGTGNVIQTWHDVPRVKMKDGVIQYD